MCIYTSAHMCAHTNEHTCIHETHTCALTHTCIYTGVHTCTYAQKHTCVREHTRAHTSTHTCTHTHEHTRVYTGDTHVRLAYAHTAIPRVEWWSGQPFWVAPAGSQDVLYKSQGWRKQMRGKWKLSSFSPVCTWAAKAPGKRAGA